MMASRVAPLLLLAALSGGCIVLPAEPARNFEVEQALQSAARQVHRCYRAPRVSSAGRLIVTRLRVRLTPDGQLAGLPVLIGQSGVTPTNRTSARPMAEAAIAAVLRCAPLRLPPDLYARGWSAFELTFSPLGVA
jgi:hypothetical protein